MTLQEALREAETHEQYELCAVLRDRIAKLGPDAGHPIEGHQLSVVDIMTQPSGIRFGGPSVDPSWIEPNRKLFYDLRDEYRDIVEQELVRRIRKQKSRITWHEALMQCVCVVHPVEMLAEYSYQRRTILRVLYGENGVKFK